MKKERKITKREQGITLVALVITIIILLILAGVTLTTALSENGLFQRAKVSAEKYKEAEEDEKEKIEGIEDISIRYRKESRLWYRFRWRW